MMKKRLYCFALHMYPYKFWMPYFIGPPTFYNLRQLTP